MSDELIRKLHVFDEALIRSFLKAEAARAPIIKEFLGGAFEDEDLFTNFETFALFNKGEPAAIARIAKEIPSLSEANRADLNLTNKKACEYELLVAQAYQGNKYQQKLTRVLDYFAKKTNDQALALVHANNEKCHKVSKNYFDELTPVIALNHIDGHPLNVYRNFLELEHRGKGVTENNGEIIIK